MSSTVVSPFGSKQFTVVATGSIAVYSKGPTQVYRLVGYPQFPTQKTLLGTVNNGETIFGSYTNGATIVVEPGWSGALVQDGIAPRVTEVTSNWALNGAPNALNATGALTAAMMLGGLITSTTGSAVTATVPTGAVLDAASDFAIGDEIVWSVINTGASNDFTVTTDTDHTLVGVMAVQELTQATFRTRKTAAATFITYRMAG